MAVEDVSFTAQDGSITGLLGPNGAGKSTTLRMLATLIRPASGTAIIDGHDITQDVLPVRSQLGFLPHNAGIYPRLTARENIYYYARLCGQDKRLACERVDQLIEQLAMADFADRRSTGLSQGQKTKVALARAMVHQPHTIMLDEPTNGLDVMATRGLRKIIRQLASDGRCVLFSSHIMQEVSALCDHIAIISAGKIVMEDSLERILNRTGEDNLEDAFVAATQSQREQHKGS
ncbi:MAG: ATP-binding cassette domain-containing protein [Granulosicoccus sp.]|nr:ATP-binding cassette domain-containing protein [Granulosicoccus sp.]